MSNNKPFNREAWSLRKSLLQTIRQAWHQVDRALIDVASLERAQVSGALRALETAVFSAEVSDAKRCLDTVTNDETTKDSK